VIYFKESYIFLLNFTWLYGWIMRETKQNNKLNTNEEILTYSPRKGNSFKKINKKEDLISLFE